MPAQKRITDQRALQQWRRSEAYRRVVGHVSALADAVVGKRASEESVVVSQAAARVLNALDEMRVWVAEIPPVTQAMRYGNKAFKTWHTRMVERAPALMLELLSFRRADAAPAEEGAPTTAGAPDAAEAPSAAGGAAAADSAATVAELCAYWCDAFGNETRIDYGTGHELALLAWLLCLEALGVLGAEDRPAVGLRVFARYLELMRELQTVYWLEPAGSHGVWGLDDYQFLPFIIGAAQLVNHDHIRPASIHDAAILEEYRGDYLYLAAVHFIIQVKKGGRFGEHSPYLNDISALDSWQRVTSGLMRMYEGEVLGKFPVVQHLKFGAILEWPSQAPGPGADAPRP